jgi:hypothetical protein
MANWLHALKPKRRWAQVSLRMLFVLVTVLCVALSLGVVPAERQRRAVAAIEGAGGSVAYPEPDKTRTESFPNALLRRWLPRDYLDEVQQVNLGYSNVTDAPLAHLHGFTRLQVLYLHDTRVTDAGLTQLHGLTDLQLLCLFNTQVTDAGLAHLQELKRLQTLWLRATRVTDAGLAHLQGLTRLQSLVLDDTRVTDAGLAHLQGLTGMQSLYLYGTHVTDAGLAQLRRALPRCYIEGPCSFNCIVTQGSAALHPGLSNCAPSVLRRWAGARKLAGPTLRLRAFGAKKVRSLRFASHARPSAADVRRGVQCDATQPWPSDARCRRGARCGPTCC